MSTNDKRGDPARVCINIMRFGPKCLWNRTARYYTLLLDAYTHTSHEKDLFLSLYKYTRNTYPYTFIHMNYDFWQDDDWWTIVRGNRTHTHSTPPPAATCQRGDESRKAEKKKIKWKNKNGFFFFFFFYFFLFVHAYADERRDRLHAGTTRVSRGRTSGRSSKSVSDDSYDVVPVSFRSHTRS